MYCSTIHVCHTASTYLSNNTISDIHVIYLQIVILYLSAILPVLTYYTVLYPVAIFPQMVHRDDLRLHILSGPILICNPSIPENYSNNKRAITQAGRILHILAN